MNEGSERKNEDDQNKSDNLNGENACTHTHILRLIVERRQRNYIGMSVWSQTDEQSKKNETEKNCEHIQNDGDSKSK